MVKMLAVLGAAALGYYLPGIYLTNIATKRSPVDPEAPGPTRST